MSYFKTILFFLALVLIQSGVVYAQIFPVQVNTQISPPYSPYLYDYTAPGSQRIMTQIRANDITLSDYMVKLRLTIEGVGIRITTKQNFTPQPITIEGGGIPLILYGEDLAEYFASDNLDFAGFSKREFEKTGKLPEGVYRFIIEVLDYNRGTIVSNKGSAIAWMILNDPPLLNLPKKDAKVRILDPTNIPFTWTPRHTGSPNSAFSTEYIFRMVEIWPANRNPYDAFLSSPTLYEVTTSQTQIIYGMAEPALIPGRKYAWQVEARDIDGRDLFKNQGKSEVYVFQFGDELGVPENLRRESANASSVSLRWEPSSIGEMPDQYRIKYRASNTDTWNETITQQNWVSLPQLSANTAYDVQVRGEKESRSGEYSTSLRVSTLAENPDNGFRCGDPAKLNSPTGSPVLLSLAPGDIVSCSDFRVVVTEVTRAVSGSFSGKGLMQVKMFNGANVEVAFNGSINSDYQFTSGGLVSTYEVGSAISQVVDEMLKIGEEKDDEPNNTSSDTTVATYVVPVEIVSVTVNDEGKIVVTDETGSKTEYEVKKDEKTAEVKPTIIQDKSGDQWVVKKDPVSGETTVTKIVGGAANATATVQPDPIKDKVIVLILEQFEEEIGAWLRINGKGGEDDEDVLLAKELPSCFPEDADVLKPIKENTIPYFKEHPGELRAKIEVDQTNKQVFDRIKGLFTTESAVDLNKADGEDKAKAISATCMAIMDSIEQTNPITERMIAKARALHQATGKQVIGFLYCKECNDQNKPFRELSTASSEITIYEHGSKVCTAILFKFDGDNFGIEQHGLAEKDVRDLSTASLLLPTLGSTSLETLTVYGASGGDISCTSYLENEFFNTYDFCQDGITEKLNDQLLEAVKTCVYELLNILDTDNSTASGIVSNELSDAVNEVLNNGLTPEESIKVAFVANGVTQVVGKADARFTVYMSQNSNGVWEISLNASKDYLETLPKFKGKSWLDNLVDELDKLARMAQVNFCEEGQIDRNCINSTLRFVQVLYLNVENVGTEGTIHKSMWLTEDGKRHLLPESALWTPVMGGAVDGVTEEVIAIPLLIKTLGELLIFEDKRTALKSIFTEEGMEAMKQSIAKGILNLIEDPEKREYGLTKATVEIALFYLSVGGTGAQTLSEALESATELANKLENSPTLSQYLVELSKLKDEGIPKAKQLDDILNEIDPAKLEEIVLKIEPAKIPDLLDDLASTPALRRSMAEKPELVEVWGKLIDVGVEDVIRNNPSWLKKVLGWTDAGLEIASEGRLLNEGNEVGRIVGDRLHVRYTGFGNDIICDPLKTTSGIGKYSPSGGVGTKQIIESKLSKSGENPEGINILNDTRNTQGWSDQRIWDEINQPWLNEAIARGDNIRAVSDPLDIRNVFTKTDDIPVNVFASPQSLAKFLKNLNDPILIKNLSFYGREIRHLSQNNYLFDLTSKTFVK